MKVVRESFRVFRHRHPIIAVVQIVVDTHHTETSPQREALVDFAQAGDLGAEELAVLILGIGALLGEDQLNKNAHVVACEKRRVNTLLRRFCRLRGSRTWMDVELPQVVAEGKTRSKNLNQEPSALSIEAHAYRAGGLSPFRSVSSAPQNSRFGGSDGIGAVRT